MQHGWTESCRLLVDDVKGITHRLITLSSIEDTFFGRGRFLRLSKGVPTPITRSLSAR